MASLILSLTNGTKDESANNLEFHGHHNDAVVGFSCLALKSECKQNKYGWESQGLRRHAEIVPKYVLFAR